MEYSGGEAMPAVFGADVERRSSGDELGGEVAGSSDVDEPIGSLEEEAEESAQLLSFSFASFESINCSCCLLE